VTTQKIIPLTTCVYIKKSTKTCNCW